MGEDFRENRLCHGVWLVTFNSSKFQKGAAWSNHHLPTDGAVMEPDPATEISQLSEEEGDLGAPERLGDARCEGCGTGQAGGVMVMVSLQPIYV